MTAGKAKFIILLTATAISMQTTILGALPWKKVKVCEIVTYDSGVSKADLKKCGVHASNRGVGKKTPLPKKIAIAGFQIHWEYLWDGGHYEELTDTMYDLYVQMLEERGIEVVSLESVKATDAYRHLKKSDKAKATSRDLHTTAYGLKRGGSRGTGQSAQKYLSGINKELGTDAVFMVYATIGSYEMEETGLRWYDKRERVLSLGTDRKKTSFKSAATGHPMHVEVYAGYKETKKPGGGYWYFPKATSSFGINIGKKVFADNRKVEEYMGRSGRIVGNSVVTTRTYKVDSDGFSRGALSLFAWGSTLSFDMWRDRIK